MNTSDFNHVYKSQKERKPWKRLGVVLALITFIISVIVATNYKPLSSDKRAVDLFSYKQFIDINSFYDFLYASSLSASTLLAQQEQYFFSKSINLPDMASASEGFVYSLDNSTFKKTSIANVTIASTSTDANKTITADGKMTLVSTNKLQGINTDSLQPEWEIEFIGTQMDEVFATKTDIYVVTKDFISPTTKCPLPFAMQNNTEITTPCEFSYYPNRQINASVLYTVIKVSPVNGAITRRISLVGGENTKISVASDYIYFLEQIDLHDAEKYYAALTTQGKSLLPAEILIQTQRLDTYNISFESKAYELESMILGYRQTLSSSSRETFDSKLREIISNEDQGNLAISSISLDDLDIVASKLAKGNLQHYSAHVQDLILSTQSSVLRLSPNLEETISQSVIEPVKNEIIATDSHLLVVNSDSLKTYGANTYLNPLPGIEQVIGLGGDNVFVLRTSENKKLAEVYGVRLDGSISLESTLILDSVNEEGLEVTYVDRYLLIKTSRTAILLNTANNQLNIHSIYSSLRNVELMKHSLQPQIVSTIDGFQPLP
ncbi:hypothetical protein C4564_04010 [Candidatus Microgenomates bacterium]|nr:MAG: hypothetical protein C4564_04010 [Candidatus Microgenomates bacterium]